MLLGAQTMIVSNSCLVIDRSFNGVFLGGERFCYHFLGSVCKVRKKKTEQILEGNSRQEPIDQILGLEIHCCCLVGLGGSRMGDRKNLCEEISNL